MTGEVAIMDDESRGAKRFLWIVGGVCCLYVVALAVQCVLIAAVEASLR